MCVRTEESESGREREGRETCVWEESGPILLLLYCRYRSYKVLEP